MGIDEPALPPIESIRPGIWCIPVPLPVRWLRYVLVYVFESPRGPYLVDAGWNTDEAYLALRGGLENIGFRLEDVQGVLVTHIHPDHYGLAGRIRELWGAWIALHPIDAELIHDRYEVPELLRDRLNGVFRRAGVPAEAMSSMQVAVSATTNSSIAKPDLLIEHRDTINIPGWDLLPLWTPGHPPGHLSFYEGRNRLMLTGDHVLPRITPNIPLHPQAGDDPLGDYLRSLDHLGAFDVDEALPAHEHRFTNFHGRLAQLKDHHAERFVEVTAAVQRGAGTAWNVASQMAWSRPWERIVGGGRRSAVLEALAHLRQLERQGVVHERSGEPSLWQLGPE